MRSTSQEGPVHSNLKLRNIKKKGDATQHYERPQSKDSRKRHWNSELCSKPNRVNGDFD